MAQTTYMPLTWKNMDLSDPRQMKVFQFQLADWGNQTQATIGSPGSLLNAAFPNGLQPIVDPNTNGFAAGIYNRRQWWEDFTGNLGATAITAGPVVSSQLTWGLSLVGTSTALVDPDTFNTSGLDAVNKCVGVWGLQCGTLATNTTVLNHLGLTPGLGALNLFFRIATAVVPTVANNFNLFVGINDSSTAVGNNAIGLILLNNGTGAVWRGTCKSGGVASNSGDSNTPTIVAYSNAALSFYKVQISINAAWNSVSFFVNGTQIGSAVTSNISTSVVMNPQIGFFKTAGTTNSTFFVDNFFADYQFATP
jgi:hypothetical protein